MEEGLQHHACGGKGQSGVLKKRSEDSRNEVRLLSGLQVKGALEVLAKEVPKVGIVAENG